LFLESKIAATATQFERPNTVAHMSLYAASRTKDNCHSIRFSTQPCTALASLYVDPFRLDEFDTKS